MIGTTCSRVNFFMNKFLKLGFIDYKDRIEVHNSLFDVILNDKSETQAMPEQHEFVRSHCSATNGGGRVRFARGPL